MRADARRTDVTDEVVGAVGFPPDDAERLRQHEAVLRTQSRQFTHYSPQTDVSITKSHHAELFSNHVPDFV